MITGAAELNVVDLVGLSTDTKPINNYIANGSTLLEMDTAKVFMFDKENMQWIEFGTTPEPKPEPADPIYNHYINWHGYFMIPDEEAEEISYSPSDDYSGVFTFSSGSETTLESLNDFYIAWINSNQQAYLKVKHIYTDMDPEDTVLLRVDVLHMNYEQGSDELSVVLLDNPMLDENDNRLIPSYWLIITGFEDYSDPDNLPQEIDELVKEAE